MPAVDLLLPGSLSARTGGTIYDRRIAEGLSARGWTVGVHSLDPSFPFAPPAAIRTATATLAALPPGRLVVFDGLVLGAGANELTAAAHHLRRVALVHHPLELETGLDAHRRQILRDAERAAWATMLRIVVTSRWTAATLAASGVAATRIRVVEPGTDPAESARPLTAGEPLNLLCVASLTPRKAHALLLEALAGLTEADWRLRCVGSADKDPATATALAARTQRLGFGARVQWLGELSGTALEAEYRNADLFVLASDLEGYGMAAAEALAHGVPVVGTAAGALPDTLPPAARILVAPGDGDALAAALAAVLTDRGRLAALAAGARAARAALPGWDRAADAFAAALEGLVG